MPNLIDHYKKLCNKFFFSFFVKNSDQFLRLKKTFISARIPMIFETYLSIMHFTTIITFLVSFIVILLLEFLLGNPNIIYPLIFGALISGLTYLAFYLYPYIQMQAHKNSIEMNLPFAILYLNILIKSGVSPQKAIEILSKRKEFGGVSREAKHIVSLMRFLGQDFISALINTSRTTCSEKLKSFLYSIVEVIKSEGDLRSFFDTTARNSLIDFKMKLKEFDEKLSFIITIYTALFVAFPLIIITMLTVFSITLESLSTLQILKLGIIILLPIFHLIFLYFIMAIKPKV